MTIVASAGVYLLSTSVELGPNASRQPRPEAGARHERTLEAVACTRLLGKEPPPVALRKQTCFVHCLALP